MIQIDMPMPDNCVECRFNVNEFGHCGAMPVNFCGHVNDFEEDGRPEWCPLKAQEPRVMTLEEASNSTVPMWFEKSGDECGWITGIDCSPIQATTIGQVDGDDWYNLAITDYGRLWRCWTANPGQATREATPWERLN